MTYLKYKGQRYDQIDTVPHIRAKDGSAMRLAVWRSRCATCGELFEIRTTTGRHNLRWPTRRCEQHKRPGVRVPGVGEA